MAYTNNVPQGNQQIATTQPIIQANFGYLQTAINQEHNFDTSDASKTYHLKASMPNQADPGSLPTGTNGQYYVSGGVPKFYNSSAQFIQLTPLVQNILTGTLALSKGTPVGFSMPASSMGNYYLEPPSGIGGASAASAMGQFVTSTSDLAIGAVSDPGIDVTNPSSRNIRFEPTSNSHNGTYKYVVVYYTP